MSLVVSIGWKFEMQKFKLSDLPAAMRRQAIASMRDSPPVPSANVECDFIGASAEASSHKVANKETGPSLPRWHIKVHCIRHRQADVDGLCAKWVIDGLIDAGILADDSPKYVDSITFTQEQGNEEKTIITIE